jgi:hypothetical protein
VIVARRFRLGITKYLHCVLILLTPMGGAMHPSSGVGGASPPPHLHIHICLQEVSMKVKRRQTEALWGKPSGRGMFTKGQCEEKSGPVMVEGVCAKE